MKTKQIEKPVRVQRNYSRRVSFDKAFKLAKSKGQIIISNKRADQILDRISNEREDQILDFIKFIATKRATNRSKWIMESVGDAFPINTGTMTAFIEPGKRFGATVEHKDCLGFTWVFEVPAGVGLRGLKDTLLAVEHPNYDLDFKDVETKKRIIVIPQKELILPVTNFPAEDGWYATDPNTGIPTGIQIGGDELYNPCSRSHLRFLRRSSYGVCPVIRGTYSAEYDPHEWDLDVLFSQQWDLPAKSPILIGEFPYRREGKWFNDFGVIVEVNGITEQIAFIRDVITEKIFGNVLKLIKRL